MSFCNFWRIGLLAGAGLARAQSPEPVTGGEGGMTVGANVSAVHLQYGEHWLVGAGAWAGAYAGMSNLSVSAGVRYRIR